MWSQQQGDEFLMRNGVKVVLTKNVPETARLITIDRFKKQDAYIIPDGEPNKNFEQVINIQGHLIEKGCNRTTVLSIQGGGMALDIGGFSASIFMRGIGFNYIPTTLLSMVDASVGGKTGINFRAKNMVGSIRQPLNVYINTDFLSTLGTRQLMNGMAEVIKMSFLYDAEFFRWLQRLDKAQLLERDNILQIVKRSIQLKIKVVAEDVNQEHQRKWLNFGHTVGHAIETVLEPDVKHGECVAIGMVAANKIALELGILKSQTEAFRLKNLLEKFGLPTKIPEGINVDRCLENLLKDKKQSDGHHINFVLARGIGIPNSSVTKVDSGLIRKLIFARHFNVYHCPLSTEPGLHPEMFPSSKSLSIRYLYAGALSVLTNSSRMIIQNCLLSEDTHVMVNCLRNIGFVIEVSGQTVEVLDYKKVEYAKIYVGNSGLTARFLVPLCVHLGINVEISCEPRMQERPNSELFRVLQQCGASFVYLKSQFCFPVTIQPSEINFPPNLEINGKDSSQFISSILMLSPLIGNRQQIIIKGASKNQQQVSYSFIKMTIATLKSFDIKVQELEDRFIVSSNKGYHLSTGHIGVEPDYAGISYPYTWRLLNGLSLPRIEQSSLQGDREYYSLLSLVKDTNEKQLTLNFNGCTDTFMTLLVYVVCSKSSDFRLEITNISNQRDKESNRISAMVQNLRQVANQIQQLPDGLAINGGVDESKMAELQPIVFQSYKDHRIAMSMGILSAQLSKRFPLREFVISDPDCVNKTFPKFWTWMATQGVHTEQISSKRVGVLKQKTPASFYLLGMRGCGKSTFGKALSSYLGLKFRDTDQILTDEIRGKFRCDSIQELVQKHGWSKFRSLQTQVLKSMTQESNVVVATGGGVVESQLNRHILRREECIYIERNLQDLESQTSDNLPKLPNSFRDTFARRQPSYLDLAKTIITLPSNNLAHNHALFFSLFKLKYQQRRDLTRFVVCLDSFEDQAVYSKYDGVEFRIDTMLQTMSLKEIRFLLSRFREQSSLPTVLTVRSREQYGNLQSKHYTQVHQQLTKIPTQFVDCQITKVAETAPVPNPLWSYHGSQTKWIQEMKHRTGLKKIVLQHNTHHKYLQQKYANDFDLFWTMGVQNRHTRLESRVRMVSKSEIQSQTGIMSKQQFLQLGKLLGKVIR